MERGRLGRWSRRRLAAGARAQASRLRTSGRGRPRSTGSYRRCCCSRSFSI